MKILSIETSCDETALSVIEIKKRKINIISDTLYSQIKTHQKYGGVVPEIAAREHTEKIIPVLKKTLDKAKINIREIDKKIDLIAVTKGPGLITSLMTGIETAKTLAWASKIPIIGINHIEGHIYSAFIKNNNLKFPNLILTVSGGHNILVLQSNHLKYKILGQTRDDAAGEAFDKVAKILELNYPGGPEISKQAKIYLKNKKKFQNNNFSFPRPMINSKNFDFSFSGLKTAVLYQTKKDKNYKKNIPFYAYEFQEAVNDCLVEKTIKAAKNIKIKNIILTGGVSANKRLRIKFQKEINKKYPNTNFIVPDFKYCTDNAIMIGVAAYYRYKLDKKINKNYKKIKANCNFKL